MKPSLRPKFKVNKKNEMDDWLSSELKNIGDKPMQLRSKEQQQQQSDSQSKIQIVKKGQHKNTPNILEDKNRQQILDSRVDSSNSINMFKNQQKPTLKREVKQSTNNVIENSSEVSNGGQIFKRPFDGTRSKFIRKTEEKGEKEESQYQKQIQVNGQVRMDVSISMRPFSNKRVNKKEEKKEEGEQFYDLNLNNKPVLRSKKQQDNQTNQVQEQLDQNVNDQLGQNVDNNIYGFNRKKVGNVKTVERQIKLDGEVQVDDEKIREQEQRVNHLKYMICLDHESFDSIFEMKPQNQYSRYISNLTEKKKREIKLQSKEEESDQNIQTDGIEYKQTGNQCPEDRIQSYFNGKENRPQSDQLNIRFQKYLEFVQPLIDSTLSVIDQNKRNIQTKQLQHINRLGIPDELDGLYPELVYIPNINGLYYKYLVYREQNEQWILEYTNEQVSKVLISSVEVKCVLKLQHYLISGGGEGQIQVYYLNSRESERKTVRLGHQIAKYPSFQSDYIQSQQDDDMSIDVQDNLQSEVVGLQNTLNNKFIVLQQLGILQLYDLEELNLDQQQKQYIEMGIRSRVRLVKVRSINLNNLYVNQIFYRLLPIQVDNDVVYVTSSQGISKIDSSNNQVQTNILESNILNAPIHSTFSEYFYVVQKDQMIVLSKKYSSMCKQLFISENREIVQIQTFILELKVKETQKRLKIEDTSKLLMLDRKGILIIYDIIDKQETFSIDLWTKVKQEHSQEDQIRSIQMSEIDMNYTVKVVIIAQHIYELHLNLIKYIERDFRVIKKKNQQLQEIFSLV